MSYCQIVVNKIDKNDPYCRTYKVTIDGTIVAEGPYIHCREIARELGEDSNKAGVLLEAIKETEPNDQTQGGETDDGR